MDMEFTKDRPIRVILIVLAAVIAIGAIIMGANYVAETKCIPVQDTNIVLSASADEVEIGDSITFTVSGKVDFSAEMIKWNTDVWNVGDIKIVSDNEVIFTPKKDGIITMIATINSNSYSYQVEVFPQPVIEASVEPWIYTGNQYKPVINTDGMIDGSVKYWIEDQWNDRLSIRDNIIYITTPGNYQLIVTGRALMDGRAITQVVEFSALPEIKRGYHSISMEEENLLSFEPWQQEAVERYLANEYGLIIDLSNTEDFREREVNRISGAVVFYRDSSRSDQICYQTDVKTQFIDEERSTTFYTKNVKVEGDARYWTIGYDGFMVTLSPNISTYYLQNYHRSTGGGSSSSSSGGGGSSTGSGGRGTA